MHRFAVVITLSMMACAHSADRSESAALETESQVVAPPAPTEPQTIEGTTEAFVKMRCDVSGADTYTQWTGSAYAYPTGERPQKLFDLLGMNVARCWKTDDGWVLSSRELMFYLDPKTGAVLQAWDNPFTSERVPVMHVANDPVQAAFGTQSFPYEVVDGVARLRLDVPLFYPNALGKDPKFAPYSPQPNYQAGEFFVLTASADELASPTTKTVSWMALSWHRISPWLPWMKMGDRAGYLVFSAHGSKVAGYDALPERLRTEIDARLAAYRRAPSCWLDVRNETSWSYFAKHLDAYLAKQQFPMVAPTGPEDCARD